MRDGVVAGSRRRRSVETTRQIWRAAPIVAGIGAIVAAVGRWAGWPAILPAGVLVAGFGALALYASMRRRDEAIPESLVARLDDDAVLRGELRSANWFATRDVRSDWAELHVERAADHLQSVDWQQLYPVSPAGRARLATVALVVATIALAVSLPGRTTSGLSDAGVVTAASRTARARVAGEAPVLPPDLLKQLEALLGKADPTDPKAAATATPATAAELRELLKRLGQLQSLKDLKDLARALDPNQKPGTEVTAKQMKELAEKAQRTAENAKVDQEVKESLEDLAEKMSEAAAQEQQAGKEDPKKAMASQEKSKGESSQSTNGKGEQESDAIKSVKEAQAGGGAGMMMMSGQDGGMGGDPGAGLGGDSAPKSANGVMANIEQALRKETIEAATDNPGDNVITDARRKSEHGNAKVTFTRGAAGTFDRSHAAAPPAVPEGRRTAVQTYFIRKQ